MNKLSGGDCLGQDVLGFGVIEHAALDYCKSADKSIRRLVHGRGGCVPGLEQITLDGFNNYLLLTVFKAPLEGFCEQVKILSEILWRDFQHTLVVQRRDVPGTPYTVHEGEPLPESLWVVQKGLTYQLRFGAQNTGLFLDMESARDWLKVRVQGKKVLNLFSYTCAFSVVAMANGAQQCTNVDMSSSALSWGRENHRKNNIATNNIQFLALNILKSWSRIKKYAPYDIIIIDPPSFQKGSFVASRDYVKLIKRIEQLASSSADVLACLNAPEIGPDFLKQLVEEHWSNGRFKQRLDLPDVFVDVDKNRQLKLLHFVQGLAE